MPLYDYVCSDCGESFEALVLRSNSASCPRCQGQNLEQQISLFAVDSESVRQTHIASARKKNAKVQKEKMVAEREAALHHDD